VEKGKRGSRRGALGGRCSNMAAQFSRPRQGGGNVTGSRGKIIRRTDPKPALDASILTCGGETVAAWLRGPRILSPRHCLAWGEAAGQSDAFLGLCSTRETWIAGQRPGRPGTTAWYNCGPGGGAYGNIPGFAREIGALGGGLFFPAAKSFETLLLGCAVFRQYVTQRKKKRIG